MPLHVRLQRTALMVALTALAGCSSVLSGTYLHNEGLKEKTDQAQASFDQVDDQSGFFRSASEQLAQAGKERLDSRRRRLDAIHELAVATLISDSDGDGAQPAWERATRSLSDELSQISAPALEAAPQWGDIKADIEATRADVAVSERRVALFARNYKAQGGTESTNCAPQMTAIDAGQPGSGVYRRMVRACSVYLDALEALGALRERSGITSTEYHARRNDLASELAAANSARALLKDRINAAKRDFDEESVSFRDEAVESLSERGKRLADMLSSLDDLDFPDRDITVLGVELAKQGEIIDGKTLAESVRADILSEEIEELIKIMSDPDIASDTDVQKEARRKYLLIVESDSILRGIRAFKDMDYPVPQSALMLLEHYRNQRAAYDRQAGHLSNQLRLSVDAATAAERKIEHLLDALLTASQMSTDSDCSATGFVSYLERCPGETTRVARILISMDQAHVEGTLPAELAFEASLNNDMLYGIEASRGHAAHVVAILQPAIATLKAYGDGGIKSDTVARLMNTLSLIAISVGVN